MRQCKTLIPRSITLRCAHHGQGPPSWPGSRSGAAALSAQDIETGCASCGTLDGSPRTTFMGSNARREWEGRGGEEGGREGGSGCPEHTPYYSTVPAVALAPAAWGQQGKIRLAVQRSAAQRSAASKQAAGWPGPSLPCQPSKVVSQISSIHDMHVLRFSSKSCRCFKVDRHPAPRTDDAAHHLKISGWMTDWLTDCTFLERTVYSVLEVCRTHRRNIRRRPLLRDILLPGVAGGV